MTHNEASQSAWEAVCALPSQWEVSDLRRERGYAIVRALPIEAMTRAITLAASAGKFLPTKSTGARDRNLKPNGLTVTDLLGNAR